MGLLAREVGAVKHDKTFARNIPAPVFIALAILLGIIGTAKWKTDRTVARRFLIFAVIFVFIGIWIDIYLVSL